jgi:DNA-directed RNA polymerase specialized sigma24 family protein
MADTAALSAAFESHRAHLLRVACGTLGSVADAEDFVQEGCGWRGWRIPARSRTSGPG